MSSLSLSFENQNKLKRCVRDHAGLVTMITEARRLDHTARLTHVEDASCRMTLFFVFMCQASLKNGVYMLLHAGPSDEKGD